VLLNSRAEPDLPAHVEGRAQWVLYQDPLRSAYHGRRLNGSEIPVEFINNEWYALLWKDARYQVSRNCRIPQTQLAQLGLGVWRITDVQHPDYVEPPQISPVEPREPLPLYPGNSDESRSSPSAIDSPPEYQGRDPVADDFAAAVAQLSTTREPIAPVHTTIEETMHCRNPITLEFHIASAATAITYPARYELAGGSGGGGGGGGGGSGGGDPDPDQPMNNNDPGDEAPDPPAVTGQPAYNPDDHPHSLCGSPPNIFDGTRDKVDSFLQAFGLYRAINRRHITMREPYNRIMMMLSYMKGPKIDDWVWEKATLLEAAVANGTANPNDEHMWNTFIEEFTDAFTDTTRREQATLDLINIQMKGEDLDTYISTFHHLRE
jgi:hypothetical protein